MDYPSLSYAVEGRIATLTLNRPERLNAINEDMPRDIEAAVEQANADDAVHVLILQGAGEAFCSGYDLKAFAESEHEWDQDMPWDPMLDYRMMKANTGRHRSSSG